MDMNITVFGMAHSGKSTCIGYLYNKELEKNPEYDFEKQVMKNKEFIPEYDDSRDYGYLVDEFNEDWIKTHSQSGTTKRLHYKKIEIDGMFITVIDTPGSEHKNVQRQKGMYYGDIGVFCIEIGQLLSDDLFSNRNFKAFFMATLLLWSKYHGSTIVAITKMDLCEYDEESYLMGCEIIKQLCSDDISISDIVPISIDVKGRKSHNIDSASEKMNWYNGKTLVEAIKSEIEAKSHICDEKPLLFYIDRMHLQTTHSGRSWRIKIIQGRIKQGEQVVIAPVRINGEISSVTARIKNIRLDLEKSVVGEQVVDNILSTSFAGINLQDIKSGSRKLTKDDFETIYTSCGFSSKSAFKCSNKIIFKIGFQKFERVKEGRQMSLLWFGRAAQIQIITKRRVIDGALVTAEFLNRSVAMPLDSNGKFLIKHMIIRYDSNMNEDPFLDAELIDIVE